MDCHKDLCQHCIILDRHAQIYKDHLIIQKELVKEGIYKDVIEENKKAEEILKKLNEASTEQIEEKLNQLNKEKDLLLSLFILESELFESSKIFCILICFIIGN